MKIIARQEAIDQYLKFYFTGKPCSRGHIDKRFICNRTCYSCSIKVNRLNDDPSKKAERDRVWSRTVYYPRAKNTLKYKATRVHFVAIHRANRILATPKWSEKEQIKQLYILCKFITKQTGTLHEVDHIIPLNSEFVCGLHCIDNLQIITKVENASKSNKFK